MKKLESQRGLAALALLLAVLGPATHGAPVPGEADSQAASPGRSVLYMGPDGEPLPFTRDEEVLDFLRDAKVISEKELTNGINRPLKLELLKDGVRAHGVFRKVDVRKPRMVTANNVYIDFEDRYIFECAAYTVSRLLGMDNVPPCVVRILRGNEGTLQLFIEDAMSEETRRLEGLLSPSSIDWARQRQTQYLFDALIRNFDRNQRNLLIDKNWKLWLIDHTRAFHRAPVIDDIEKIVWCEASLWEKLQALDQETVSERLSAYLDKRHIKTLMKRRDILVEYLAERIAKMGAGAVLYDGTAEPATVSDLKEGVEDMVMAITSDEVPVKSPDDDTESGTGGGS